MARWKRAVGTVIVAAALIGIPSTAASARPGGHGAAACQAREAKLQAKEQKLAEKGKSGGAGIAGLRARANRHCRS